MPFRKSLISLLLGLGLLLAPLSLCNTIVDQVTVGSTHLITVNADPSTSTGIVANQGSIAFWNNGGTGQFYLKTGSGNTAWTRIFDLTQTLAVGNGGLGITSTPSNGQIPIGNGTNYVAATLTAGTGISVTNASGSVTIANTSSTFLHINHTGIPKYASSSTITVDHIYANDSTNTVNLSTSSSNTLSTGTLNAVNGLAQSSAQTGTVTYANNTTTVTGSGTSFTTVFVAGDVIYDSTNSRTICTVATTPVSNTSLTCAATPSTSGTAVAFKRGGLSANTFYFLYAITNGTTVGLLGTTRSVGAGDAVVDLPSGYTTYRELALAFLTDGSSNIQPFTVSGGWPTNPQIIYDNYAYNTAPFSILSAGTATTFTTLNLSTVIPKTSRSAILFDLCFNNTSGSQFCYLRQTGSAGSLQIVSEGINSSGVGNSEFKISTNSSQQIDYHVGANTSQLYVDVRGFIVTQVD